MKKTRVLVTIKKDVLDPAGVAVKKTLMQQGLIGIADVRIGKAIDITYVQDVDIDRLMPALNEVSKTLLSNPIVEDVAVQIIDEN